MELCEAADVVWQSGGFPEAPACSRSEIFPEPRAPSAAYKSTRKCPEVLEGLRGTLHQEHLEVGVQHGQDREIDGDRCALVGVGCIAGHGSDPRQCVGEHAERDQLVSLTQGRAVGVHLVPRDPLGAASSAQNSLDDDRVHPLKAGVRLCGP